MNLCLYPGNNVYNPQEDPVSTIADALVPDQSMSFMEKESTDARRPISVCHAGYGLETDSEICGLFF